jgi:diguanylate cyclase (GGDEF)-like protein
MLGWMLKIPAFVQVQPSFVPMQFNTALCFSLSGLTILLRNIKNPFPIMMLAFLVMIITGLTFIQYCFDINFGIDELFVKPFLKTKNPNPGRMAPNTAVCFILFSLYIYFSYGKHFLLQIFTILLPCIVGVLGLISVTGYIFNVEQAYSWVTYSYMAIHTAIGFVLLAVASFLQITLKTHFSKINMSKQVDYAIFMSTMLFVIILFQVIRLNYIDNLKIEAINQINIIDAKMSTEIQTQIEAIVRFFSRYSSKSYSSTKALDLDVDNYFKDMPALESISFKSNGRTITRINPFKEQLIINTKIDCLFFDKPITSNLIIGEKDGYLCLKKNSATAVINLKEVAKNVMQPDTDHFNVVLMFDQELIFKNNPTDVENYNIWNERKSINIYGNPWIISVSPTKQYIYQRVGRTPYLILLLGTLSSFLLIFILRYRRRLILNKDALISSEVIKDTILNSTVEGIVGVNKNLKIYFMNEAAQKLLNITFDNSSNLSLNELVNIRKIFSTNSIIKKVNSSLHRGKSIKDSADVILKENGHSLPISYSSSPIIENNKVTGAIIVFTDSTQRLLYEEKLRSLALYDSLTNLPNRFYIMSHLNEVISRAQRNLIFFSVCYIDIDKFKSINDNFGHDTGDKVLQYLANIIVINIRKNDFVGRIAGDEFCLILDGVSDKKNVDTALKKIYLALVKPFRVGNISIHISFSVGVVIYTNENTPEELLAKADAEMYKNKNMKKNVP